MKTILLAFFAWYLMCTTLYAQNDTDCHQAFFTFNKCDLTFDAEQHLKQMLNDLNGRPIEKFLLEGYADSRGSNSYNKALAQKRVDAVKTYLISHGIKESEITTNAVGECRLYQPVHLNRKVKITIFYQSMAIQKFSVPVHRFFIDNRHDTSLIVDAKGSTLFIPKNCFTDKKGEAITGLITIKYKSYNNAAEMAFSGIPMTYRNKTQEYLFNSSGMFEVLGEKDNVPVHIKKGAALRLDYYLAKQNDDLGFYELKNNKQWIKLRDINPVLLDVASSALEGLTINAINPSIIEKMDTQYETTVTSNNFSGTIINNNDVMDPGHTYPPLVQGLSIKNFGIYNCDQIYRLSNRADIEAKYVDQDGREILQPQVLSLIDLSYNGAFSFDPAFFSCNTKARNVLVLFTKDQQVYLLDAKDFPKMNIKRSGIYTLVMKNVTNTIKNTEDLAKYLALE